MGNRILKGNIHKMEKEVKNKKYGYTRCSTTKQDVAYAVKALIDKGIQKSNIYIEYISGSKTRDERPEYNKLMSELERNPGSELYATDLTRMARNYTDVFSLIQDVEKYHLLLEVSSLRIDCRQDKLDPISEITIMILGIFATFDLKLKRQQILLGLEQARASGKKLGAPIKTKENIDDKFYKYYAQYKNKQINLTELSKLSGCCRNTCYNRIKIIEES